MWFLNDLGRVCECNLKRWTIQAKECYLNGLNCSKCTIPEDFRLSCKMKPTVVELVKKFGAPK